MGDALESLVVILLLNSDVHAQTIMTDTINSFYYSLLNMLSTWPALLFWNTPYSSVTCLLDLTSEMRPVDTLVFFNTGQRPKKVFTVCNTEYAVICSINFDTKFHRPHLDGFIIYNCQNQQLYALWERKGAYRVLVGKTEGRRPLGRPYPKW